MIAVAETSHAVLHFSAVTYEFRSVMRWYCFPMLVLIFSGFSLICRAATLLPAALLAFVSQSAGETDNLELNSEVVPLIVMRPIMKALPVSVRLAVSDRTELYMYCVS